MNACMYLMHARKGICTHTYYVCEYVNSTHGYLNVYMYFCTWIGQHVIKDLRNRLFKHIILLRMTYFDNTPIGSFRNLSEAEIKLLSRL